jgi:hypothetical protein
VSTLPDQPAVTIADLEALEGAVAAGLAGGDVSGLNVVGFGEISVALGWPIDDPRFVCKRTPPFTPNQFAAYHQLVTDYVERLQARGLAVADTTVMSLDRGDRVIAYLVQPMLPSSTLGHNVLAGSRPDADHPFLVALADTLDLVGPTLSLDAQGANFSWDGPGLALLDGGTPFRWDDDGALLFDMEPFLRMIPAPTRPLVRREMMQLLTRWRDPRLVALDVVANLYREGLADWVDPAVIALNHRLVPGQPIDAGEARALYDDDVKTWPRLKRLQAVERWWQSRIRRRPYDFFIHTTYG